MQGVLAMNEKPRYVLFDLDETIYPPTAGLLIAISERFTQYMIARLGYSRDMADGLRKEYEHKYGSTTRGILLHHKVDPSELLAFVHDVPIYDFLSQDKDLDCLLDCIHARKCIFTNGTREYARKVLKALDVEHHFYKIFDIRSSGYCGKPDITAYLQVCTALRANGRAIMLLDDSLVNTALAKRLGWQTVWLHHGNDHDDSYPRWRSHEKEPDFIIHDLWEMGWVFHQVGVLNKSQHILWDRCLASCNLGEMHAGREHRGG